MTIAMPRYFKQWTKFREEVDDVLPSAVFDPLCKSLILASRSVVSVCVSLWLEAFVRGRCVGLHVLIPIVVCAMCVYWVLLLVWVLSLQCRMIAVTAVIGPGEGECLLVQGVCV